MSPLPGKGVFFQNTDLFKKYLKSEGYHWPGNPVAQENLISEFKRELLETRGFLLNTKQGPPREVGRVKAGRRPAGPNETWKD